jgi:hypothetical protein
MQILGRCSVPGCGGRVHYDLDHMVNETSGAFGSCDQCGTLYRLFGGEEFAVAGPTSNRQLDLRDTRSRSTRR